MAEALKHTKMPIFGCHPPAEMDPVNGHLQVTQPTQYVQVPTLSGLRSTHWTSLTPRLPHDIKWPPSAVSKCKRFDTATFLRHEPQHGQLPV